MGYTVKYISHAVTYIHTNLISGYSSCMVVKAIWEILVLHDVKTQLRAQGSMAVSRRRLTKTQIWFTVTTGVSPSFRVGVSLGQSCFA